MMHRMVVVLFDHIRIDDNPVHDHVRPNHYCCQRHIVCDSLNYYCSHRPLVQRRMSNMVQDAVSSDCFVDSLE